MVEGDQKALAELSRKIHYAGYREELTPAAGIRIQQDAAGVLACRWKYVTLLR